MLRSDVVTTPVLWTEFSPGTLPGRVEFCPGRIGSWPVSEMQLFLFWTLVSTVPVVVLSPRAIPGEGRPVQLSGRFGTKGGGNGGKLRGIWSF